MAYAAKSPVTSQQLIHIGKIILQRAGCFTLGATVMVEFTRTFQLGAMQARTCSTPGKCHGLPCPRSKSCSRDRELSHRSTLPWSQLHPIGTTAILLWQLRSQCRLHPVPSEYYQWSSPAISIYPTNDCPTQSAGPATTPVPSTSPTATPCSLPATNFTTSPHHSSYNAHPTAIPSTIPTATTPVSHAVPEPVSKSNTHQLWWRTRWMQRQRMGQRPWQPIKLIPSQTILLEPRLLPSQHFKMQKPGSKSPTTSNIQQHQYHYQLLDDSRVWASWLSELLNRFHCDHASEGVLWCTTIFCFQRTKAFRFRRLWIFYIIPFVLFYDCVNSRQVTRIPTAHDPKQEKKWK